MFHPAASIEYTVRRKTRSRIHVQAHAILDGYTVLTFADVAADTVVELTLSPGDLAQLVDQLQPQVEADPSVVAL